ncbi:MAG: hypothetical protein HY741_28670 [Chloroflexi bacterium]|nr:hypothetical protein [Chloroflexota bacterium]
MSRIATVLVSAVLICGAMLFTALTTPVFKSAPLGDFTFTFYPAANYALRGENIYFNAYPNPYTGREYPPYSPVWIVNHALPFAFLPLAQAEALRLYIELALLPLIVWVTARWAKLKQGGRIILLGVAPWFIVLLSAGQILIVLWAGVMLCYYGLKNARAAWVGIGIFFLLLKPHLFVLILIAVALYAWRGRILMRALVWTVGLSLLSSIIQPGWIGDVWALTVERLTHPRTADSVLLLPFYPWAQLLLLGASAAAFIIFFTRDKTASPTRWLWALLINVGLVAALHTFVYDWLLLLFPIALVLKTRSGVAATIVVYGYALVWAIGNLAMGLPLPSPAFIPAIVLVLLCIAGWSVTNGKPLRLTRHAFDTAE